MKSHELAVRPGDFLRILLPTAMAAFGFIVLLKMGDAVDLLPPPARGADWLSHQYQASHSRSPASIVLVGDSTCLMGPDAAALSERLPGAPDVINLALVNSFDFDIYGAQAADFIAGNPGQVKLVVCLVSPSTLVEPKKSAVTTDSWHESQRPTVATPFPHPILSILKTDSLGIQTLRSRLLDHLIEPPTRHAGAELFGFPSIFEAYMTAHHGSLVDSGCFTGKPPWRLPRQWTAAFDLSDRCQKFRAALPPGVRLVVGVTPMPLEFIPVDATPAIPKLLQDWGKAIQADVVLTNLPPALPSRFFGKTAHLNSTGQELYTAIFARQLSEVLAPAAEKAKEQ